MTWLCKPLHLPFLLDLVVGHLVVPSFMYYFEWIAWPNQLLLTVFSSLRICWNLISIPVVVQFDETITIHVLTVYLNSKLLLSANSNFYCGNFCCGQSVLLPSKNSGLFHHILQPDNATISIPHFPILAGFISALTKFYWVGSVAVRISPIWLATKGLNFLLGFFTQYKTLMLSHHKTDFFITWSLGTNAIPVLHLAALIEEKKKIDLSQPELLVSSNIYQFLCWQGFEVLQTTSLLYLKYFLEADHPNQSLKSIPPA